MSKKDLMFYDIKGYVGAVAQVDDGMKTTGQLVGLMDQRARIENEYAQKLNKWSQSMGGKLKKMKEHEHCAQVWAELIDEANCTAAIHRAIGKDIQESCVAETKSWKGQTWKTSFFGASASAKEFDKKFSLAQKDWASLVNRSKKEQGNYDKACRAAATQQQTVGNLSAGAGPDDPKVQNAQRQLETKQLAKENAKTAYENSINELGHMKDSYKQGMDQVFNEVAQFEKQRLDFCRSMMIKYREASKVKIPESLAYPVKTADKNVEPEQINVLRKIAQIDAAVQNQNPETALQQFKNSKGPGNALDMAWPQFEDYNPDAIAQQNKFKKANNGESVARNDTEGTIRQISDEGTMNGGYSNEYDEPSAQVTSPPAYEPPSDWNSPVEEPEPPAEQYQNGGEDESGVYVTVQFPYEAMDSDELTLEEGEQILQIGEPDTEGWCQGRKANGTTGMFPIDYVDQGQVES